MGGKIFVNYRRDDDKNFAARVHKHLCDEFGPDNVIYHEGAKYQINRAWLPSQNPEKRFVRAKLCRPCGYLHEGDAASDECAVLHTQLTADDDPVASAHDRCIWSERFRHARSVGSREHRH